ncbi:IS200/IS605 family accessory protein TnpB-related protein [Breznakia pachnodae]|uniref:IS605 OrfB family transposase n=1 Tax=Breznakia pachnodae TaxID=265178 RepID=A0ABU0DZR0_9FIRM|nr:IS200/IS605 family accessory protein TnpB-related protein [Breznakia pachnodae]MDQ0360030.1 IS605 OrfB family transposase [Breznakia pachnodae]
MSKTISQSQRFYLKHLSESQVNCIHHDLKVYNQMYRYTYRRCYDDTFYNVKMGKGFQKKLKARYGTSDYMPLSVISDVKAKIKTSIQTQKYHEKRVTREHKNIQKKHKKVEKQYLQFKKVHNSLISISQGNSDKLHIFKGCGFSYIKQNTVIVDGIEMNLYLFEELYIKVMMKRLNHRLKMLLWKMNRKKQEIANYKKHPKQICFGSSRLFKAQYTKEEYINNHQKWREDYLHQRNKQMTIQGRRQGKYGNNLFKYELDSNTMMYRGIKETIYLPIEFHYQKELLEEKVKLKHNTLGKAICYVLELHSDYFIIKAVLELPEKETTTTKVNGVVGIDINVDHIALTVTNEHGNIINTRKINYKLKRKTSNQRLWILREVSKEVINICKQHQKTLIIENLNFTYKKQQMKYNKKRVNEVLSNFAYMKIVETIESRAYKDAVAVERVNPAYTSKIGKEKYQQSKGLSTHLAASYVIARRGMSFTD